MLFYAFLIIPNIHTLYLLLLLMMSLLFQMRSDSSHDLSYHAGSHDRTSSPGANTTRRSLDTYQKEPVFTKDSIILPNKPTAPYNLGKRLISLNYMRREVGVQMLPN